MLNEFLLLKDMDWFVPVSLLILASLAGGANTILKDEHIQFSIGRYILEVLSSITAGAIVYLVLQPTSIPQGIRTASSALAAYFGTKVLLIFYEFFIIKTKDFLKIRDKE